ncbi:MAG: VCBS repeat-containing protein [Candidatus Bipolaricaulaceae bacterium]
MVPFGARTVEVLAVGDITGDGQEDVVVSDPQAVLVFAAQADGSFREQYGGFYEVTWQEGGRFYTVTGAVRPWSGALVDLDRDGALDLVVGASGARHEIHLFRNTGRGGLDKAGVRAVPAPPHELWVADFTEDGVLDVLVWTERAEYEGELFLLEGADGFAFGELAPLAPVRGRPLGLADLDGDGFLDLIHRTPDGVGVLRGTGRRFGDETFWTSPYGKVHHGVLRQGGREAVLATHQGVVSVGFRRGGFEVLGFVPVGPSLWVHLLDLSGDGEEDALVLTRRGPWVVLAGKAQGGFHPPSSEFLLPGPLALRGSRSLSTLRLGTEPVLVVGTTLFPVVLRTGRPPAGETSIPMQGSYLLAVGDLSGNGAPDLVVEGVVGVDVLWNNGQGAFVRRSFLKEPLHVVCAAIGRHRLYLLALAERAKEKVALELWVLSACGEILAQEVLEELAPGESNTVQPVLGIADFDADGQEDVLILREDAVLVKWGGGKWQAYPWEQGNLGLAVTGQFTQATLTEVALLSDAGLFYLAFPKRTLEVKEAGFSLAEFPLSLARGDLDRDGLDDVVLLTVDAEAELSLEHRKLSVNLRGVRGWAALSSLGVRAVVLPPLGEEDVPWPLTGLGVADLTGEGMLDLVFSTVQGAGVFVLPGRGDGTFAEAIRIPRKVGPIFAADLDGNGQPELVGSTLGFNPCLWIRWNGGGR